MIVDQLTLTRWHSDCAIKVDAAYFEKCFCFGKLSENKNKKQLK